MSYSYGHDEARFESICFGQVCGSKVSASSRTSEHRLEFGLVFFPCMTRTPHSKLKESFNSTLKLLSSARLPARLKKTIALTRDLG